MIRQLTFLWASKAKKVTQIWVKIKSGKGNAPDRTNRLSEPGLIYHQLWYVAYTLEQIHHKWSGTYSVKHVLRLNFLNY